MESDVVRTEIKQMIDSWLPENLAVVQYQRFKLLMGGMSIREITKHECIDYNSTNESIKAVQKKLQKLWRDAPSPLLISV